MSKHILLVHDLAGYGKVSLSAMMPVLSHMGHHLYTLPTALVSNTLDYGKFYIQETTEYMRQSLKVWAELGFSFDVVSTGMIQQNRRRWYPISVSSPRRKARWSLLTPSWATRASCTTA